MLSAGTACKVMTPDEVRALLEPAPPVAPHQAKRAADLTVEYDPDGNPAAVGSTWLGEKPPARGEWDNHVRSLGLDLPDGYHARLVEAKHDPAAWHRDQQGQDAVTRPVWRLRFAIEARMSTLTADDLNEHLKPSKRAPVASPIDPVGFVVAIGDTQLGKPDGDGSAGTVQRVTDSTIAAVARVKELRRIGRPVGPILLAWLGDCVENFSSQGGSNVVRTDLTLTEMVRVYRRLLLMQVKALAPLTDNLTVTSIPGNHDEALRINNRMATRFDDSWAVEGASTVADHVADTGGYGHVRFVLPGRDELTTTIEHAGTIIGCAHGHQMRAGKAMDWWAGQSHGMQPIGGATMLLSGHRHHLSVLQSGPKLHVQVPAMESESTWWRHRTGQVAPSGMVTFTTRDGSWGDLAVL